MKHTYTKLIIRANVAEAWYLHDHCDYKLQYKFDARIRHHLRYTYKAVREEQCQSLRLETMPRKVLFRFQASLVAQMVKRLPAMGETWVRSLGWEDSLEKEMAIHSSTFAWKISWTEESGRLQSMGSQKSDMTDSHECEFTFIFPSSYKEHEESEEKGLVCGWCLYKYHLGHMQISNATHIHKKNLKF